MSAKASSAGLIDWTVVRLICDDCPVTVTPPIKVGQYMEVRCHGESIAFQNDTMVQWNDKKNTVLLSTLTPRAPSISYPASKVLDAAIECGLALRCEGRSTLVGPDALLLIASQLFGNHDNKWMGEIDPMYIEAASIRLMEIYQSIVGSKPPPG